MSELLASTPLVSPAPSPRWRRLVRGFLHTPSVVLASFICTGFVLAALFAPYLAAQNPYDPASYDLLASELPPAWMAGGDATYLLGTDDQGRSISALMLYGLRISMMVGVLSILIAAVIGILLGLISGYSGGVIDMIIMRIADVQMSFPPLLVALLIDGLARVILPVSMREQSAVWVLIFAIAISKWVLFARTVRATVMVERRKEYVQAAYLLFRHPFQIMIQHVLPNVIGPVLVIATINFAMAILTEATLSFLGVGVPPTQPSLGTLIKIGNEYLFSGRWWITVFPGLALIVLVLAFNVLGDWLRDVLNPRLRTGR